jgi:hypothetical protein
METYAIFNNGDPLYYVAIDGVLQTGYDWVVNGMTIYYDEQYIFVGTLETWMDYYGEPFSVFNLKHAVPYGVASDNVEGALTLSNGLHLDVPCLAVYDGTVNHYLTIKEVLQHGFINSDLYEENTPVTVGGVQTTRYDIFGNSFLSFDIVVLQSLEEETLHGILMDVPNPSVGLIPLPGLELAFISDNKYYYLDNVISDNAIIVGNDTVVRGMEFTATLTSTMRIDNLFEPYYRVFISEAVVTTNVSEHPHSEVRIFPNPTDGMFEIVSDQPIKGIYVYDNTGCILFNKTCNSQQTCLDLQDYKSLAIIQIVFENGQKVSRKVTVK